MKKIAMAQRSTTHSPTVQNWEYGFLVVGLTSLLLLSMKNKDQTKVKAVSLPRICLKYIYSPPVGREGGLLAWRERQRTGVTDLTVRHR